jgi:hypothetical protein
VSTKASNKLCGNFLEANIQRFKIIAQNVIGGRETSGEK